MQRGTDLSVTTQAGVPLSSLAPSMWLRHGALALCGQRGCPLCQAAAAEQARMMDEEDQGSQPPQVASPCASVDQVRLTLEAVVGAMVTTLGVPQVASDSHLCAWVRDAATRHWPPYRHPEQLASDAAIIAHLSRNQPPHVPALLSSARTALALVEVQTRLPIAPAMNSCTLRLDAMTGAIATCWFAEAVAEQEELERSSQATPVATQAQASPWQATQSPVSLPPASAFATTLTPSLPPPPPHSTPQPAEPSSSSSTTTSSSAALAKAAASHTCALCHHSSTFSWLCGPMVYVPAKSLNPAVERLDVLERLGVRVKRARDDEVDDDDEPRAAPAGRAGRSSGRSSSSRVASRGVARPDNLFSLPQTGHSGEWAHMTCLQYAARTSEMDDRQVVRRARFHPPCSWEICGRKRGCVACVVPGCKKVYHLPCAAALGGELVTGTRDFVCAEHVGVRIVEMQASLGWPSGGPRYLRESEWHHIPEETRALLAAAGPTHWDSAYQPDWWRQPLKSPLEIVEIRPNHWAYCETLDDALRRQNFPPAQYEVVARRTILAGEVIGEYCGVARFADTMPEDSHYAAMIWVPDTAPAELANRPIVLDASEAGNETRYINSVTSWSPPSIVRNVVMNTIWCRGSIRIVLEALCDIRAGQSVVLDYNEYGESYFEHDEEAEAARGQLLPFRISVPVFEESTVEWNGAARREAMRLFRAEW